ncbi:hypothetical protein TNCV_1580551 [Trichonephila clavipes]|nr:hypothetical protein TNCV_1580551 [Trichonephila clavipes]
MSSKKEKSVDSRKVTSAKSKESDDISHSDGKGDLDPAATASSKPGPIFTEEQIVQFIAEARRMSDERRRTEKPGKENIKGCFKKKR